jgi:hypothetical protein
MAAAQFRVHFAAFNSTSAPSEATESTASDLRPVAMTFFAPRCPRTPAEIEAYPEATVGRFCAYLKGLKNS